MSSSPEPAPGPRGPLLSPTFWLHHAALAVVQEAEARLRPIGLTYPQFSLLGAVSWLVQQGGPPTQQDVARFSGADRMMTSKVLRALEARGLVTREPDPDDGRAVRLRLTRAGQAAVHRAVRVVAEVDAEFFGVGPPRERVLAELRALAERRRRASPSKA
jgi:DNA-binding MarR family transcriptional regulator